MCHYVSNVVMDVKTFPKNLLATSGLSILLHGVISFPDATWERSGSVVECLTRDRRAAGSSLTGVTALWSLSKTHLS